MSSWNWRNILSIWNSEDECLNWTYWSLLVKTSTQQIFNSYIGHSWGYWIHMYYVLMFHCCYKYRNMQPQYGWCLSRLYLQTLCWTPEMKEAARIKRLACGITEASHSYQQDKCNIIYAVTKAKFGCDRSFVKAKQHVWYSSTKGNATLLRTFVMRLESCYAQMAYTVF